MIAVTAYRAVDVQGLLSEPLRDELARTRCVTIVGLPGMGKSLCVRELASLSARHAQQPHLLQWDLARLAWDTPSILARYPEIDGVTHAVIRKAAGLWVRDAVQRWFERHGPGHQLLIEAPLVGGRFSQLAAQHPDAVESLLSGESSAFLVMLPTLELQQQLRQRRSQQLQPGGHALEQHNASVAVLDLQMQVLAAAAARLGLPPMNASHYNPTLYESVMRAVLRHRRVRWLRQSELVDASGSVYDLPSQIRRIEPDAGEVARTIAAASSLDPAVLRTEIDHDWALT